MIDREAVAERCIVINPRHQGQNFQAQFELEEAVGLAEALGVAAGAQNASDLLRRDRPSSG